MANSLLGCPSSMIPRHALWKSGVQRAEAHLMLLMTEVECMDLRALLKWALLVGDVFVGYSPDEDESTMFPDEDDDEDTLSHLPLDSPTVPCLFLRYEARIHRLGLTARCLDALYGVYSLRTGLLDAVDIDRELAVRWHPGLHDLARRDKASEYCLRGLVFDADGGRLIDSVFGFLALATSLMETNLPWEPDPGVDRAFNALVDLIGEVSIALDDTVYEEGVDYLLRTANLYMDSWPVGEWEGYNGCDVVAIFCDFFKQLFLVLNALNRCPSLLLIEGVRSTSTDRVDSIGFNLTMSGRRVGDVEVGRATGANFLRAGDKFEYLEWNFACSRLARVVVEFLLGMREWVVDEGEELFFRKSPSPTDDEVDDSCPQPWQVRDYEPFHFRFDEE